jgi:hypothetical protein
VKTIVQKFLQKFLVRFGNFRNFVCLENYDFELVKVGPFLYLIIKFLLIFSVQFEGSISPSDSVSTKLFIKKTGGDDIEGKVFQFLFDGDGDGEVDFGEVLQAYAFMETDGKVFSSRKTNQLFL